MVAVAALFMAGCTNVGPETVARDRFDYNTAIADSWKEQTLLNIVKARYADMPVFVEVASVVNGYTPEGSVNLGRTLSSENAVQGDLYNFGTTAKYSDPPTIIYAPVTGQQFNNSFTIPIPPRAVLFLMQSGWPADLILPLTVDAMNGLRAEVPTSAALTRQLMRCCGRTRDAGVRPELRGLPDAAEQRHAVGAVRHGGFPHVETHAAERENGHGQVQAELCEAAPAERRGARVTGGRQYR